MGLQVLTFEYAATRLFVLRSAANIAQAHAIAEWVVEEEEQIRRRDIPFCKKRILFRTQAGLVFYEEDMVGRVDDEGPPLFEREALTVGQTCGLGLQFKGAVFFLHIEGDLPQRRNDQAPVRRRG